MDDKTISFTRGKETQEVALAAIKHEIAQLLQVDNLSFLLGAGCSSHVVDGEERGIPGMSALYDKFFLENPDFKVGRKDIRELLDKNLEKLIENMNAIQIVNQIQEIDPDIENKLKTVSLFLRDSIISGSQGDEVKAIYKEFYLRTTQKNRKNPINIFTTNYDLYSEMALDDLGFHYNNGFTGTYNRKFNPVSYNYLFVENMNLNRDVWERVSTFYNLVKLHGSISWVRSDEEIRERDFEQINEADTVMIYPTPMKDRSTLMVPYSDLFRSMENQLMHKNSVLITIGYSFNDDHINRVILNSLAVPTFRLVVFGGGEAINRLKSLSNSRISIISSDDNIHYFNNIVNEIMPSIHPDVEETISTDSVGRLITEFEDGVSNGK